MDVRGQRRNAEGAAPGNLSYVICAALIGLRSPSCALQQLYDERHLICSADFYACNSEIWALERPAIWQQDHSWLELSEVSALMLFLGGTN